jgi:hypothetical protein
MSCLLSSLLVSVFGRSSASRVGVVEARSPGAQNASGEVGISNGTGVGIVPPL